MAHSEDAPLATESLAGSEEALVLRAEPRGGSNSRAFKIAGLTTLACLLLASQVFTAYMVFGQRQQITSLQANSERMDRRLTRTSQGSQVVSPMRMRTPMSSLPLLKDFTTDEGSKTPATKLQDTAVSVEKQVKELMQNSQLPQFNETFLVNLQSLKHQMNDTEWLSFESWMRYWLIFQMAQQQHAHPTTQSALIKTKCQMEAAPGPAKIGSYKPQCDEQGKYMPMQCWHATGYCWCVDESGTAIDGTTMRGHPECGRGFVPSRMMSIPRLMQKTISLGDDAQ